MYAIEMASEICEAVMLVFLMGGIYELHHFDWLRYHVIRKQVSHI
jgi:hypothetical protein